MRDRLTETGCAPPNEDPIHERAAEALYRELERLDPTGGPNWTALPEGDKHLYRSCIDVVAPILGSRDA